MNLYTRRYPISAKNRARIEIPGYKPVDFRRHAKPPGPPYEYRITGLVTSQLNIAFAFSLDLPETFTSKLTGDMMFYLLELMALLPETPDDSGNFRGMVWGLGVRVGIASTKFDSRLAASIAGVAASATLKASTASYGVTALGLGHEVIEKAGPFFTNIAGNFDATSVDQLGKGLQDISRYVVEQAKDREPVPVYVVSETPRAEIAKIQAISACYALNHIRNGRSYDTAAAELKRQEPYSDLVNLTEVMSIYQQIVNNAGSEVPSDAQKQRADKIWNLKGNYP